MRCAPLRVPFFIHFESVCARRPTLRRGGSLIVVIIRYAILDGVADVLPDTQAEGTLKAQPVEWIRNQLKAILNATGNRAKNSILCKSIAQSIVFQPS